MPSIKLNKFSRSQEFKDDLPPVEPKPKNKGGRPKKTTIQTEPEPEPEPELQTEIYDDEPQYEAFSEDEISNNDDFLSDLNNENYKEPVKELKLKLPKEPKIREPKTPKPIRQPSFIFEGNNNLFDDVGTEIIGRDKRELIARLNQYKSLFPEELKNFKVKKNANATELKAYVDEAESIVDCSSIENFMTDSILQCIRIAEGVSSYNQKYDIQGCAELLKSNKQFHSLCKQCYVKYKIFSAVPPEAQLIMLVATTAYITNHKNRNKSSIESFLNREI
jgi:hypothetical protein